MFDTVRLVMPVTNPDQIVQRLRGTTVSFPYDSGDSKRVRYRGYLGNLRVQVTPREVRVEGSLPTFLGGFTLSVAEARACIVELSDLLGVDLAPARVTRLDIFTDVVLNRLVPEYLYCLLTAQRYGRCTFPSGVRYEQGWRHLVFYDKHAEMRQNKKKLEVPASWDEQPVLRYEVQMRSKPATQLNWGSITFHDLTNARFRAHAASRALAEYHRIEKRLCLDWTLPGPPYKAKEIKNSIQCVGLTALGPEHIADMLDAAFRAGQMKDYTRTRLRQWVREASRNDTVTSTKPLIVELNAKLERGLAGR